jgi:hypothetical protein
MLVARLVFSSVLYNNLKHNNNINPITYPLNITFEKLGNILRAGFIQGRLDLDHDPNNRMTETVVGGVHFYDDKKKYFVNPNLGVSQTINQVQYSSAGYSHGYTAQAITEGGEGININIPYTAEQRGYSHSTFIRISSGAGVQDVFKDAVVAGCGADEQNLHYDSNQGFC